MRFLLGLLFGASLTYIGITLATGQAPMKLDFAEPEKRQEVAAKPAKPVPEPEPEEAPAEPEPVLAAVPAPRPPAAEIPTPNPITTPKGGRQAVWTPFRSEASARGFAGRLSTALEHPFEVERLAPHTYVVTFDYRSESQRSALEAEVNAFTGGGSS